MSRTHEEEYNDTQCELAAWELLKATKSQVEELKTQLEDAKATADLWIQKAKHADEAAADLVAELIDTRREWKAELTAERALADRLGLLLGLGLLLDKSKLNLRSPHKDDCLAALAAWKEARK
jgi:hypothetical protein